MEYLPPFPTQPYASKSGIVSGPMFPIAHVDLKYQVKILISAYQGPHSINLFTYTLGKPTS